VGLLAVACLVLGNFFASQIITPFGSQVQTSSTGLNNNITSSPFGLTAMATCSSSPCTIDVTISEHVGITEFVTGTASHVMPTIPDQATENLKAFLNVLGTLFLFVAVALLLFRWKSRHND
jgi:hypothetical protein